MHLFGGLKNAMNFLVDEAQQGNGEMGKIITQIHL
jgi:hypothetical protein